MDKNDPSPPQECRRAAQMGLWAGRSVPWVVLAAIVLSPIWPLLARVIRR